MCLGNDPSRAPGAARARRGVYGGTRSYRHAHLDPCADLHARTYRDPRAHSYGFSHGRGDSYCSYCYPRAITHCNASGSRADSESRSFSDCNADVHTRADCCACADRKSCSHSAGYLDSDTTYATSDIHTYSDARSA